MSKLFNLIVIINLLLSSLLVNQPQFVQAAPPLKQELKDVSLLDPARTQQSEPHKTAHLTDNEPTAVEPSQIAEIRTKTEALEAYGRLPLSFIPNRGQLDEAVLYSAQGAGQTLWFGADGLTIREMKSSPPLQGVGAYARLGPTGRAAIPSGASYLTNSPPTPPSEVNLRFVNANPTPQITNAAQLPGLVNYFVGNDPQQWQTNVPTYGQITYHDLWSGIDLLYEGHPGALKSTFFIAPGADPTQIQLTYPQADSLNLDEQGNLLIQAGSMQLRESSPIAWQDIPGQGHQAVLVNYQLAADGQSYTFALPQGYNPAYPLVIDPELVYSTFLGAEDLYGRDIAVDEDGNVYLLINSNGASGNNAYVYVIKINASGSAILHFAYLSGSSWDYGSELVIDDLGYIYAVGTTSSSNFPVTPGAFSITLNGNDAFVVKMNPADLGLVYATFLGGSGHEDGSGLAVDDMGQVYVTGSTMSSDFPVTPGAFDSTCGTDGACNPNQWGHETFDVFVAKFNSAGTSLQYATFLGGNRVDFGHNIAVDDQGNVYLAGVTLSSSGFPITAGAFDTVCGTDGDCNYGDSNNTNDVFVIKLNANGTEIDYGTFLGGSQDEYPMAIAVNEGGNAYILGHTQSWEFPATPNAFDPYFEGGTCGLAPDTFPCSDIFVVKMNLAGSNLDYSTFLGGTDDDTGVDLFLDHVNNAYVVGGTTSSDFPITPNAMNPNYAGGICTEYSYSSPCPDAFLAKLNAAGSNLIYSTFIGGSAYDLSLGITMDKGGNIYLTGDTTSADFPVTPGVITTTYHGKTCGTAPNSYPCRDGFVMKQALKSLEVGKYAPPVVAKGQPITYTLTVANYTGITLTNVVLTDVIPINASYIEGGTKIGNVISWTIPSLPLYNGVTQTTFVVTATQTITNSNYRVTASGGYSSTASVPIVTIMGEPNLIIHKSGPSIVETSHPITYTLTVTNYGLIPATNVVITDALPVGANFVQATNGGQLINGQVVSWTIPTLAANGGVTHTTFMVTATQSITNSNYRVTARGGYSATGNVPIVTIMGQPNLSIHKSGPSIVEVGQPLTYTLSVTNYGLIPATNVVITDALPAGANFVHATNEGQLINGQIVSWTIPTLAANGGVTQTTFMVTATQSITNSNYRVTASGDYSATGNVPIVTIMGQPNLSIHKSGPSIVEVGQPLTYTLIVTNCGLIPATNVVITDALPIGANFVQAANGGQLINGQVVSWTIPSLAANDGVTHTTFVVTATQTITNNNYRVTASGDYSATGNVPIVTIVGEPNLIIHKSGPSTVIVSQPITYTLSVTNYGLIPVTNVVITDVLPVGANFVQATNGGQLINGQVVSWTIPTLAANGGVTHTTFVVTATQTITNSDYGLLADGGYGAMGSQPIVTLVNEEPIAGLIMVYNFSPSWPTQPLSFLATVTAGSGIINYTWSFGDGSLGFGETLDHTYLCAGNYTAQVTATNSYNSMTASTLVTVPAAIPPQGGTICLTPGVTLTAISGVFSETIILNYTLQSITSTGSLSNVGLFYDLSASYLTATQIAQPQAGQRYTITVTYRQEDLPAGINEADLALYYWNGSEWVKEPSSVVDVKANTISATPDHFSLWAALATNPNSDKKVFLPLILKE